MENSYNSDYDVKLAIVEALGGDPTKYYDSQYSIDLDILRLSIDIKAQLADLDARVTALEPEPPQPDDEIWYTTTDGEPLDLSQYQYFRPIWFDSEQSDHGTGVVSNTYTNGKGVIKLGHALNGFDYYSFYLEDGDPTLLTLSLPDSIQALSNWEDYPYIFGESCFTSQSSLESVNYNGTKAQFMAILPQCATEWNYYCASWTIITCTDGNLTVDPETGAITDPDA